MIPDATHILEVNSLSEPLTIQGGFSVIPDIAVTSQYCMCREAGQVVSLGSISPPSAIEICLPPAISQQVDSNLSLHLSLVEEVLSGDQVMSLGTFSSPPIGY